MAFRIYIAASYRHLNGVQLLGRELKKLGCAILDWTTLAVPPPGLTAAQRRIWMDTDKEGGEVFTFCHKACIAADLVIYYGESGQDAGVEIGLAAAAGTPIIGLRGPLESPGLMLHGAVRLWVDTADALIEVVHALLAVSRGASSAPADVCEGAWLLARELFARRSRIAPG